MLKLASLLKKHSQIDDFVCNLQNDKTKFKSKPCH